MARIGRLNDLSLVAMYNFIHRYSEVSMHRTQIYLPDELYQSLKAHSLVKGISISEIIRQSLEREVRLKPVAAARAFFDRLTPLASFVNEAPTEYVRRIRATSRLVQEKRTNLRDEQ